MSYQYKGANEKYVAIIDDQFQIGEVKFDDIDEEVKNINTHQQMIKATIAQDFSANNNQVQLLRLFSVIKNLYYGMYHVDRDVFLTRALEWLRSKGGSYQLLHNLYLWIRRSENSHLNKNELIPKDKLCHYLYNQCLNHYDYLKQEKSGVEGLASKNFKQSDADITLIAKTKYLNLHFWLILASVLSIALTSFLNYLSMGHLFIATMSLANVMISVFVVLRGLIRMNQYMSTTEYGEFSFKALFIRWYNSGIVINDYDQNLVIGLTHQRGDIHQALWYLPLLVLSSILMHYASLAVIASYALIAVVVISSLQKYRADNICDQLLDRCGQLDVTYSPNSIITKSRTLSRESSSPNQNGRLSVFSFEDGLCSPVSDDNRQSPNNIQFGDDPPPNSIFGIYKKSDDAKQPIDDGDKTPPPPSPATSIFGIYNKSDGAKQPIDDGDKTPPSSSSATNILEIHKKSDDAKQPIDDGDEIHLPPPPLITREKMGSIGLNSSDSED